MNRRRANGNGKLWLIPAFVRPGSENSRYIKALEAIADRLAVASARRVAERLVAISSAQTRGQGPG
jgi:hypothetical protein